MASATGDEQLAARMLQEAETVRAAATRLLWDEGQGVFLASTGLERLNVDLWGNAMAGAMGFATPQQDARMFAYFQVRDRGRGPGGRRRHARGRVWAGHSMGRACCARCSGVMTKCHTTPSKLSS